MSNERTHTRLLAAVIAASLSLFAAAGNASDAVPQRTVRFQDLDLARPGDAQRLYTRLRAAAKAVCDEQIEGRDARSATRRGECIRQSLEGAVAEVNAPALTALHASNVEMRLAAKKQSEQARS